MKGFILSFLALILGSVGSFGVVTYVKLPQTDVLEVHEEVYYSNKTGEISSSHADVSLDEAEVSVHFLELGNKYTGDCTYIKTPDADILIDCGSKSNSIATVSSYLNKYVTDGTLEYVIVTHAHQDHYAGFATTTKIESIFDLYECENIITFAKTNQKSTAKMYNNFVRELADEEANGANVMTAQECIEGTNEFALSDTVTLEILDSYYYTHDAHTENDYSVCCLVKQEYTENSETKYRNFLFTGDLEADGEEYLVQMNTLPVVDLYKAGHHGSKTSSTAALIDVIKPKTVCVCCCAGSPEYTKVDVNQFPTQIFLDNVSKYTTEIYVTTLCIDYDNNEFTSLNGNIVYLVNSVGEYDVECSNNNTILKDTDWFKEHRQWNGISSTS